MPPRKRLGQLLTELGVVDEHQLQSALGHQKQWGGKLGNILVQKGFCQEPQIVSALAKHLGMPMVSLVTAKIDPRAVKFVSRQIAEKLHVFPYEVSGSGRAEVVTIAMSDPTDLAAVDQLAFHTGKRIKPMLAGDSEILSAIAQHYGTPEEKAASEAAQAPAAATPPGPAAEPFPRRFDPQGASRTPPPAQAAPQPPPPPAPEPLDLPESDDDGKGPMLGLEPIAAHTQVEAVEGAQDLSAEGAPGDAMEGFESAGVRHEGADQAWGAPAAAEPAAVWGAEPAQGWADAPAEASADPAWGADPAAAPAPWSDPLAPAAWPAAVENGVAGHTQAPPAPEGASDWSAAPGSWTDAIRHAVPANGPGAVNEAEAAPAPGSWTDAIRQGVPATEAETAPVPGSWTDAIRQAVPATDAAEEAPEEWGAAEADPLAEGSQPAAAAAEPAPEGDPPQFAAGNWDGPPAEAPAPPEPPGGAWSETPPSLAGDWGDTGETPAHGIAEAEGAQTEAAADAALAAGAEPADDDLDFEVAHDIDDAAAAPPAEPMASAWEEPAPSTQSFEASPPGESFDTSRPSQPWDPLSESGDDAPSGPPAFSLEDPEPPAYSETTDPVALETTRFAEPPGQEGQQGGSGAATPLSAVDEGTLAAVGVDPNDGVAALRTLAALVRVLQRRQLLDADELAAELRDSRAQELPPQEAAPPAEEQVAAEGDPLSHEAPQPHDLEGSPEV